MMLENTQTNLKKNVPDRSNLNKRANAFFLKISGGRFRAYSLLKHTGRKSGKEYRTPVSAFPMGDGFVLALLYGDAAEVDWCRNVMAAGKCILKTRGIEYTLEKPEVIPASQALAACPILFRFIYRGQGVQQFVWLHRSS